MIVPMERANIILFCCCWVSWFVRSIFLRLMSMRSVLSWNRLEFEAETYDNQWNWGILGDKYIFFELIVIYKIKDDSAIFRMTSTFKFSENRYGQ